MRIKQLQLTGFKSFVDRTALDFPSRITGIVGPNGCGKSNIVDSIRWVLGEQSPKHLRGDAMEAVIFNGNSRLAPLGMAEVSLTFENDEPRPVTDLDLDVSTLPAHFRNLSTITIARRYFRSGDSEYLINKIPCRLKDITELFLGTGVGSKAYGIIEQGRVEQFINAKPEERRLFIEEAAGITLYRSRRLAAERKIERARENLARVNDILQEIDRQVRYIERQAKKAEEFRRLQGELRGLELTLARLQWNRLQAEQEGLEAKLIELSDDEAAVRAALEASEGAQRDAAERAAAAEQRHARLREALAVADAERERVRERLQMQLQERQERERRGGRLNEDLEALGRTRHDLERDRGRAERERDEHAQYVLFDEGELQTREKELDDARRVLAAAQAELEAVKGTLVEHLTREVEARNALTAIERRRDETARQLGKLRTEVEAVDERLRDLDRQAAARRDDIEQLRAQLAATTGEKEAHAKGLRGLAERRRACERAVADLDAELLQAGSRLASLEQIQSNYEGFHRGVRAIMREQPSAEGGVLGVVADVIEIPEEHERAAAAALGDRLQYVIVRDPEEAVGAVDHLRRAAGGRGSFIPLEPRRNGGHGAASVNGTSRRFLDLVRVPQHFQAVAESLLGEVVLVPDLASAVALWQQNGVRLTLVTPEGDVIDPSGVITGGSDRPIEEEILARRREIEALRAVVNATAARADAGRAELEVASGALTEAEAALRTLDEGLHGLTLRIVGAEKDLERLHLERPQYLSRREVVQFEIESLTEEDQAAAEEQGRVRERSRQMDADRLALEARVAEQRMATEGFAQRADELSAAVTTMKVRVAERRERQQAAAASVESLRRQEGELALRETALATEREATERERAALDEAITQARNEEVERERARESLGSDVEAAAEEVGRSVSGVREAEEQTRAWRASLDEKRAARGEIELRRSETRLRMDHLGQTMREKYETELAAVEPAALSEEEIEAGGARVEALRTRLNRLGDVNVGAIDELRALEERQQFLSSQREDLERSLADLERTIQKLNRASRTRFAETFARVNETFQQVFPRLFRGGEGRLVLTDEHNLLETGVDIIVCPPGKRLDSVGLLSGGEKALVAVSLILSLFLINPTPFCILDEVDAPLDDANINRFSQMIREMSDRSQFIVITHNKRTMEAADVLYGVTMQEPGVSKIISVAMH